MKRIVALLLLIVVLFSVVSCDALEDTSEKVEKYCFNCGTPISKNAAFCEHCGAKMPDLNENETSEEVINDLDSFQSNLDNVSTGKGDTLDVDETTEKITSTTSETNSIETNIESHKHTYSMNSVAATCTTEGYTRYVCSCGDTYTANRISAKGHSYTLKETSPTCTSDGYRIYTCSCGNTYTETYKLQTYTATELYNQSVKYVGEIITYDNKGNEYALGTGFVISSDGKIITNYHVIEDAYAADITINNKKYTVDSVLAYDTNIDLAVLKINASGLPYARICKLPVNVGTTVYAIGSSRGMTNTCSQGIVTYADRIIDGISYVQHDASITHGNSGGPLINEYGEVIGINTWGISDSQNLNFAVFTGELDNLVYGTPKTLAELHEVNFSAYEMLLNWVLENYNYTGESWIEYRYQESGERFSIYSLTYYYNSDRLCLEYYYVFNSGDSRYVSVELSEDTTALYYYASYTDGDNSYNKNMTEGYIYPSSFTRYTSIGYYSFEGDYWTLSSLLETYQEGIVYSLEWFDIFLDAAELGLTLSDFGFNSFS